MKKKKKKNNGRHSLVWIYNFYSAENNMDDTQLIVLLFGCRTPFFKISMFYLRNLFVWNIFSVNRTLYFYSKNSPWNQYCNHIETSQLNCNPKQMNGFRMSERCFKRVKVVISVSQTCTLSRLATLEQKINSITLRKKWSFPLSISSVNVTKSAGICGFGHIYWRNPSWKTSFFVQCYFHDNCECITKASKRPFRSKFKPSE